MARVEVVGDQLSVQIEGMDKLWTLKSRLEIPLAHVTGAEADPEVVRGWKGWRGPGVQIPGVIVAGTFHHEGDRVFWDVHDAAKAVVIHLADERYARLVIGVDDPSATVAAIRGLLAHPAPDQRRRRRPGRRGRRRLGCRRWPPARLQGEAHSR
jgi:hypothetical protein